MKPVSTIGDTDLLILIGLFLVQFKLNDVPYSYWQRIGFMVRLHDPN